MQLPIMNTNTSNSSTATLVLFCRKPAPGIGKQRIAADLGEHLTCELAQLLLDSALEDIRSWPGPTVIAPAQESDAPWAESISTGAGAVFPQAAGNLGERLNALDRQLRDAGHQQIIYIGSDSPMLDPAYYHAANVALDSADVVLGPAEDGGVVLMGSRSRWPDLAQLPWSSTNLGESLELLCRNQGLTVRHLEPRYDIDLAADLPRLFADLQTDMRPVRIRLHTWLKTNKFI